MMLTSMMLAGALATVPCESLKSLTARDITITAAEVVAAGSYTPATLPSAAAGRGAPAGTPPAPGRGRGGQPVALPEHCRVSAVLTPSSDSHIEIEVWLPTTTWNGKFQAVGNGGWAGTLSRPAMMTALAAGYATASTDTGHRSTTTNSVEFALGHPEKVTDFAYRAVHEMTAKAKALINAFYERPARLSYFNGCSTGGRQGLMEAQRFPDDYDAIISGAPVYNQLQLSASQLARQVEAIREPVKRLPPEKITLLAKSVVAACDAGDGVTDGIVSRPDRCSFAPSTLTCPSTSLGAGTADCLTAAQVETVNRAYAPVALKNGTVVYPGSSRGFESGMRLPAAPMDLHYGPFRFIGRQDPAWNPMSFDLDADLALILKTNAASIAAADPNLARFKARGGKLLLYHGWADPGPAPANTVAYVESVGKTLGGKQDDWMRLFLMPGVGHCSGGVGPDQADFIGALDRWRDAGQAPGRIDASKVTNGSVEMTRPLCAYPQVAVYSGKGSTNDAANFSCKNP
jgi:feruloyl esterase